MTQKWTIGIVAVVVAVLLIASLGLYISRPSPVSKPTNQTPTSPPFDYSFNIEKTNATVIQGNTLSINLTATYLQGQPEDISFLLSNFPQQAIYSFNPPNGIPTNSTSFNST